MLRIIQLFFFIIIPFFSIAQKQTNIWYFGKYAGLDFNFNPPRPLADGALFSHEGSAVICDENGKLLFYTNGETVWNNSHQIMENGTELGGHQSSRQSAVIVPVPNAINLYYILTTDARENGCENGLRYSIVNLNINNGLGKVVEKSIRLHAPSTEGLSVIGGCLEEEGHQYWAVAANIDKPGKVYAYKIDEHGISKEPVTSSFVISSSLNYIKFSPAGNKAVFIDQSFDGENDSKVIIADFDLASGIFYNFHYMDVETTMYFNQAEFSGNGEYLFVSDGNNIKQIDLVSSTYPILTTIKTDLGIMGEFQIGPDGNIYIASYDNDKLSIIKNPNDFSLSGEYKENAIVLGTGRTSNLGLPNFVRSYLYNGLLPNAGKDTLICSGKVLKLGGLAEEGITYQWEPILHLNDANLSNPIFQYKNTSNEIETLEYVLTATNEVCSKKDTVKIQVYPAPPQTIIGSKSVCPMVVGVAYRVPSKADYRYHWEVEGGEIVGGQGSETILVDWGPTNSEAKVTLTSHSISGCETSRITLPVRINVELDTETPQGPKEVCVNLRQNIPYRVTETNGSVYTWGIDGGNIKSGQGTHQVVIDWDKEGPHKLWLQEESTTIDTVCFGTSDTLEVLVYKDTTTISLDYVSISLEDDEFVEVQGKLSRFEEAERDFKLYQREWGTVNWERVGEKINDSIFFVTGPIESDKKSYEYKISTLNPCEETISSPPHRTILLSGEVREEHSQIFLQWNPYQGWEEGVKRYEIWKRVDQEENYQLLHVLGPQSHSYTVMDDISAPTEYFRIKAVRKNTAHFSWSNELTLTFVYSIMIPNVFTPNGDGRNDTFIIDKLAMYPKNELIIYNRWGKAVYAKKGYQSNWDGEDLPSGVYYYFLRLNKVNKEFKGWVHLLRSETNESLHE